MDATLPITIHDVTTDLLARADFRGIDAEDRSGRAHYLLGMAEALLADANREILRLRSELQRVKGGL